MVYNITNNMGVSLDCRDGYIVRNIPPTQKDTFGDVQKWGTAHLVLAISIRLHKFGGTLSMFRPTHNSPKYMKINMYHRGIFCISWKVTNLRVFVSNQYTSHNWHMPAIKMMLSHSYSWWSPQPQKPSGYDKKSLPWKDSPIFQFGKPSINGDFPWQW